MFTATTAPVILDYKPQYSGLETWMVPTDLWFLAKGNTMYSRIAGEILGGKYVLPEYSCVLVNITSYLDD